MSLAARAHARLDAECICSHPYRDHRQERSADRDGVCEVSMRWLHATPSADMEPITAVGMSEEKGHEYPRVVVLLVVALVVTGCATMAPILRAPPAPTVLLPLSVSTFELVKVSSVFFMRATW